MLTPSLSFNRATSRAWSCTRCRCARRRTPTPLVRLAPAPAADFPLHHHTFSPLDIAPCSCAALGVRITGVDDATFSQTGEAYSTIALPATDSHTALTLQEDDTALAYEAPNGHLNQKTTPVTIFAICSRPTRFPLGSLRASSVCGTPLQQPPPLHTHIAHTLALTVCPCACSRIHGG